MRLLHSGKIPAFLVEDMFDASRNMFDNELFSQGGLVVRRI